MSNLKGLDEIFGTPDEEIAREIMDIEIASLVDYRKRCV